MSSGQTAPIDIHYSAYIAVEVAAVTDSRRVANVLIQATSPRVRGSKSSLNLPEMSNPFWNIIMDYFRL